MWTSVRPCLLDPVDNTVYAPLGEGFPSAVAAMKVERQRGEQAGGVVENTYSTEVESPPPPPPPLSSRPPCVCMRTQGNACFEPGRVLVLNDPSGRGRSWWWWGGDSGATALPR